MKLKVVTIRFVSLEVVFCKLGMLADEGFFVNVIDEIILVLSSTFSFKLYIYLLSYSAFSQ